MNNRYLVTNSISQARAVSSSEWGWKDNGFYLEDHEGYQVYMTTCPENLRGLNNVEVYLFPNLSEDKLNTFNEVSKFRDFTTLPLPSEFID